MKNIKRILSILLLVFLLVSCNDHDKGDDKPTITNISVLKYDDAIECGEEYDEASVKIIVMFDDGTSSVYTGADLGFDYSEFDPYTPGEQTIKVVIKPLNTSKNILVQVNPKAIKILMIANSFGDDTVQWVHEIGKDLGVEFTIANLYIGGCILSTHLTNILGDKAAYEYVNYNKQTRTWKRDANTSIRQALEKEDWDYVSLQQGSYESGRAESYNTINRLMDEVLKIKSDVEFIWNMTWAYQTNSGHANFDIYNHDQMYMYDSIVNAVQTKVVPNERFKYIIPNGTAVQNARTSILGDNLCRDVYCHLTLTTGRYIAGLTLVATLTDVDIKDIEYSPGLDEIEKAIAVESALNAIANPFSVTTSIYA